MAEKVRDVTDVNARLQELSAEILPDGLTLRYVRIDELREQTLNPRSMPKGMFNQLVANIKDAGGLESLPLCVIVADHIEIISGHHRVRAAREAGVKLILVLLYESLEKSRIYSKQIAHNTISGQDDEDLLKRVWEQIVDVQARFEAYVDPKRFKNVPEPARFTQVDVDLGALSKSILIIFLASQKVNFDAAVSAIMPKAEVDAVYLAEREIYDGWMAALQRIREDLEIVSLPTAIARMATLALEALAAQSTESEKAQ